MASFSVSTDGQLSVGTSVGDMVAMGTLVAAAQQFGSALRTRYAHQPLKELIQALNNNADIGPRHFHGYRTYDGETGKIMTMHGEIKAVAMNKVIANEDEHLNPMSSVIISLSVAMSKESLSPILASAIMLFVYGTIDRSLEGMIRTLQAKIEKYASAVLSRDSMCGGIKRKRDEMLKLVQRMAPNLSVDSLFLPPLTRQEEGDYAEFLVELWTSRADYVQVFTRSVKLLGLALLLSEYGWQIDVFVENEDGETPIKTDTRALSVIYSISNAQRSGREYVENHKRYAKMSRREFYPTAICRPAHMGEVSGLSLGKESTDPDSFYKGYRIAQWFCASGYHLNIGLLREGRISMTIQSRVQEPKMFIHERSCRQLLNRFLPLSVPDSVRNLIVNALCNTYPDFKWDLLDGELDKQEYPHAPFTTLLLSYKGNCEMLLIVCGAILGALDMIIGSLINLPVESMVRTPAGESLYKFINGSDRFLVNLLTNGLEPGLAVQFCATRLAGVDPNNLRVASATISSNIIGYWNAQQGILVTPVIERSLYCDLPAEKSKPLTLFTIPIEGMPTDDGGWIRSVTLPTPDTKRLRKGDTDEPRQCNVIIEYRPHFEIDSSSVVAAVYIEGVFCNLLSLSNTLSHYWHVISCCDHADIPSEVQMRSINLRSLTSGNIKLPYTDEVLVVSPQQNKVSRLFSSIIYQNFTPIIQNGCLNCAVKLALDNKGNIVIPKIVTRTYIY